MSSLPLCYQCGEKRVKEVKGDIERLIGQQQFDQKCCAICNKAIGIKIEIIDEIEEANKAEEAIISDEEGVDDDQDADYKPALENSDEDSESKDSDYHDGAEEMSKANMVKKISCGNKKPYRPEDYCVKNCELVTSVQTMILEGSDEVGVFVCRMCKDNFIRNAKGLQRFVAHINSHNSDQDPIVNPYQCPSCPVQFKKKKYWKKHLKTHLEKFECSHAGCTKRFRFEQSLERHVKRMHTEKRKAEPQPTICQICGTVLKYGAQSLKKHLLRHQGIRPFKCDTCNKSFIDRMNLVRHQLRHEPVKNSVCEICGKKFLDIAELRTHSITHTDVRTYHCEFCPYRAKRSGNLRAHIRNIHHPSDPNKDKCKYCGLNFLSATACRRHEKKHEGGLQIADAILKPYQCPDCGYRAVKPCQIRIHQRSHTGEKRFKCEFCERPFTQKGQCTRHMKICKKGTLLAL